MRILGLTSDVPVTDLGRAATYFTAVLGRPPDLTPDARAVEWVLHRGPEVALRLVAGAPVPGGVRVGLGVASVHEERARLLRAGLDPSPVVEKAGVLASVTLVDPDGNRVVVWQDLLGSAVPG